MKHMLQELNAKLQYTKKESTDMEYHTVKIAKKGILEFDPTAKNGVSLQKNKFSKTTYGSLK